MNSEIKRSDVYAARDRKLQLSQATKLKSIASRKLAFLEVDVKRHREIVSDLSDGARQLRLLGDHREFYLALNRSQPSVKIDQPGLESNLENKSKYYFGEEREKPP